jgi:hypothetical protein
MRSRFLVAALVCAAATSLAVPATAAAAPTVNRADAASGWLAGQLVDGNHFQVVFDGQVFVDQGLTIDAILAFASAKSSGTNGAAAITWLAQPDILGGYVGDGAGGAFAGATAKAMLAAEVEGRNPATFGGVDLPAQLRALITPSGRFVDRSQFGDFSNGFSQALALMSLRRTPGGVPVAAVNYEVGTECADGGFPLTLDTAPCVSDTDTTGFVVQALLANGRIAAAERGATWLISKQQANGGLSVGTGAASTAPNTNSTGLAGAALRAAGRSVAALRAASFIRGVQVGCAGPVDQRGAIAFDATGFDPDTAPRATTQAILGLGGLNMANLTAAGSDPAAPTLACP